MLHLYRPSIDFQYAGDHKDAKIPSCMKMVLSRSIRSSATGTIKGTPIGATMGENSF